MSIAIHCCGHCGSNVMRLHNGFYSCDACGRHTVMAFHYIDLDTDIDAGNGLKRTMLAGWYYGKYSCDVGPFATREDAFNDCMSQTPKSAPRYPASAVPAAVPTLIHFGKVSCTAAHCDKLADVVSVARRHILVCAHCNRLSDVTPTINSLNAEQYDQIRQTREIVLPVAPTLPDNASPKTYRRISA